MTVTPTPGAPSLLPGEDTGTSDSDGVIDLSGPMLVGQTLPYATITLYDNAVAATVANGTADANGFYSIYPYPVLDDGKHTLTITSTAPGDAPSLYSAPLYIVVDTSKPDPPTAPQLAAGFDTGASAEDDITDKNILQLTGTAEPGSTVMLYDVDKDNGAYAATVPAIPNPDKPLTLTDGYDTVTGLPIGGPLADYITQDGKGGATLVAPNDDTAISPLSSIVAGLDADDANAGFVDPNDVADNADDTLFAFGLNDTLDLSTLDPLAEAQAGDPAPLLVSIKLLDTLTILARSTLIGFTFQPFADFLENNDTVDLDDPAGIAAVLAPYVAANGSGVLTAQQVAEVAAIAAAGNAAIDAHAAAARTAGQTPAASTGWVRWQWRRRRSR